VPILSAKAGSARCVAPPPAEGRVRARPALAPSRAHRLALHAPVAGGPWTFEAPVDLPRVPAAEVRAWFSPAFLVPLRPDLVALRALVDAWSADPDADRRRAPAVAWLRSLPAVVSISVVRREREGGRRYAYHIPGYRGPVVASEREFRRLERTPRVLLPALPRRLRAAFPAPPGHSYILVDVDRCFPVLLATVADDATLLAAAARDFHQDAGDAMAPHLPPAQRRRIGKLFNNAVVGLITPHGLHAAIRRAGIQTTLEQAAGQHARWWARFPAARLLRDTWVADHRRAAADNRPLAIRYADGRTYTFDAGTVRGTALRPRWAHLRSPASRLQATIRTTFSALWRGAEGTLLDRWLQLLYPLRGRGLRLVLPMYDGLLLQAPTPAAEALAESAHDALVRALADVGVPATAAVEIRPDWAPSTKH
jgi:hypothetical protein